MKKLYLLMALFSLSSFAEKVYELPPLKVGASGNLYEVKSQKQKILNFFVNQTKQTDSTSQSFVISNKSFKVISPLNFDAFDMVKILPSINVEGPDYIGTDEVVRIRGLNVTHAGNVEIEDMPMPNGPGAGASVSIFNPQDISNITTYLGAIPPDQGFNVFGDFPGILDLHILKPRNTFSANIKEYFGTHDLTNTYFRVDSGNIDNRFKFFISGSYLYSHKWKGPGEIRRDNLTFDGDLKIGDALDINLLTGYTKNKHNNYFQYTFTQLQQYGYDYDYNTNPKSPLYYNYNLEDVRYYYLLPTFTIRPDGYQKLIFKPYWWSIKGYNEYGMMQGPIKSPQPVVQLFSLDSKRYGFITKYVYDFDKSRKLILGYWYDRQQQPGPPYSIAVFSPSTGELVFNKYGIKSLHNYHTTNEPFLAFKWNIENTRFEAGFKWLNYKSMAIVGQNQNEQASSVVFNKPLPYIGVNHSFGKNLNLFANYGETYAGANVNLWPFYASNEQVFTQHNINLQYLWNRFFNLTTADNVDLGLKYQKDNFYISPTLFYSFLHHYGAFVPLNANGSTIYLPANISNAKSYGVELISSYAFTNYLSLFAGYSYNKFYYTDNVSVSLPGIVSQNYNIAGNQAPDTPKNMVKVGMLYKYKNLSIVPSVYYIGRRWGDSTHTQEVPPYLIANLTLDYTTSIQNHNIDFSLALLNLFNKHYISTVWSPNSNQATLSQPTYQVGAPFSAIASIGYEF
ncbi:MAG: TonB-dependent receptor [Hydrogenobaculum sp.]